MNRAFILVKTSVLPVFCYQPFIFLKKDVINVACVFFIKMFIQNQKEVSSNVENYRIIQKISGKNRLW